MRILYVTGMCGPIINVLKGNTEYEITSLPAFFYPWYKLVKRGHIVDFVIVSNFNEEYNIKVDWFNKCNVLANIFDPYSEKQSFLRIIRKAKRFIKLMYYTQKAIETNHYDFVYCKAYEGLAGNIVANLNNIPCGMRSFGTTLFFDFNKYGAFITAILRPLEYLSFKLKKDFFIMTDDGTKGDIVYEKWKTKKNNYDFYFWKTGVKLESISDLKTDMVLPQHNYLFFACRIDYWKRHDRILKVLSELHKKGFFLHLYFAGSIASNRLYNSLNNMIDLLNLNEFVHFMGPIKQPDLKNYAYHAIANIQLYDFALLGNVFYEIFSIGSIVISKRDPSVEEFIIDKENGFLVDNEAQVFSIIEQILSKKINIDKIRKNAIITSKNKFLTLDERFDREVLLIENTINKRSAKVDI